MTTLRPYRKVRQQVVFCMIVSLAFTQNRATAVDYFINGRGDGLSSPFSYSKWAVPTSADNLIWGGGGGAGESGRSCI